MSRSFDGATTSLDNTTASPATAAPLSISVWFKPAAISTTQTLVGLNTTGGGNHQFELVMDSTNVIQAQARDTGASQAATTGSVNNGVWNFAGAVFTDVTHRFAYLNGEYAGGVGTTRTPSGVNEIRVGKSRSGGAAFNQFANGLIAYVVVWDVALSQANLDSLYNGGAGVDPTTIQGANIVAIYDLTGNESPEVDDDGALDLTVTAATFSSDNPFTLGASAMVLPVIFQLTNVGLRM